MTQMILVMQNNKSATMNTCWHLAGHIIMGCLFVAVDNCTKKSRRLKYGQKRIGKEEVCQTFRHIFDRLEKTEEGCHDDLPMSLFNCENT
jgi:hypothetical protein